MVFHKGINVSLLTYRRFLLAMGVLITQLLVGAAGQAQNTGIYSADLLAMQGRWIRTDAPYVIELRHSKTDMLEAFYFNPRPIHVEKTETAQKDGFQYVMIELRDLNYEGSIYLLHYNREHDALSGIYIHGATGQRFQVNFSRKTSP